MLFVAKSKEREILAVKNEHVFKRGSGLHRRRLFTRFRKVRVAVKTTGEERATSEGSNATRAFH
jgi:hypothetical protein